ncbi:TPA: hypothetical protein I7721_15115 [Vibrio vulnificus]|nr:hypothetical protein [Vibrio vulnificus]
MQYVYCFSRTLSSRLLSRIFSYFYFFLLLTPDAMASFGWRLLCLQFLIYSIYWQRWHLAH